MSYPHLTYLDPAKITRSEQWAKQDAENKFREAEERKRCESSMDSFTFGAATGIAVGPRSALGSVLRHQESPASSESESDNSSKSGSSSDSSSGGSE